MGAALGRVLRERDHDVVWAASDRSAETRSRAELAGLRDVGTVDAVAHESDVLLSVCPPHAAEEVARSVSGFEGVFVDANAVSPVTTRAVAAAVESARFVDGGIVGSPPVTPGATRLYLSGTAAPEVAELFDGTIVDARVISDEIGAASAMKMVYAAWTKGAAALLLAIRAVARAEGIEATLVDEWRESLPELVERSRRAARSAGRKGWRWDREMEEIASTFAAAGLPDGFHRAAAEVFRRSPRHDEATLDDVLAALLRRRLGGADLRIGGSASDPSETTGRHVWGFGKRS
jgi:3-hydroxyisobutyrate dehydrogenase-like beta-hydroxyacid dehydrogenase